MTTLADGQSEFDTVTVRCPDAGVELTDVESIEMHSSVLIPTDTFKFTVDNGDPTTVNLLIPGTKIEIAVNDRMQLTGYIGKKTLAVGSGGGTKVTIEGRDILGSVVASCVNPKLVIGETMTAADVFAAVLASYGITTLYNDGSLNVNLQTGATQKPKLSTENSTVQIPHESIDSSDKVTTKFSTVPIKLVSGRPSMKALKALKLSALKPHQGEGGLQYLDRVAKMFGLRIYAAADGSGVIVDAPDFTTAPTHTFIHSLTNTDTNNALEGTATWDFDEQPGCIVASAQGGMDAAFDRTWDYVIAINELNGTDSSGQPLQAIKDIIAQYPNAKVLPLRSELQAFRKNYAATLVPRPHYLKFSEARNVDQLEGFVRREMALFQHKALLVKYTMSGLSQDAKPFATNVMASVHDDVFGVDTNMYVFERAFSKARGQRTMTHVTLCLPYTVSLQG